MTGPGVADVEADKVGMDMLQMYVAIQVRKTWEDKNGDISGTIDQNDLIFDTIFLRGCPNYRCTTTLVSVSWHYYDAVSIGICVLRIHLGSKGVNSLTVIQIT